MTSRSSEVNFTKNYTLLYLLPFNAETVRSLDLPVFGQVKLRGISDRHLVPADVVKIRVRLTTNTLTPRFQLMRFYKTVGLV